jgi:hypothetical protein
MGIQTSRRLAGIRFEVQPPPLTDVLPRMDVAVFVGFATSGPLHIPVAVEDVIHFTAIFGDDLPLAWDEQQGEVIYAYLAPAVRAFFRNGGRRCWIIRVASALAVYNLFSIPGMVRLQWIEQGKQWDIRPALIQARSAGSWSDGLQVNAALISETAAVSDLRFADDKTSLSLTLTSDFAVEPGRLLQLTYTFKKSDYILFALIDSVTRTPAMPVFSKTQVYTLAAHRLFLFKQPLSLQSILADTVPAPSTNVQAQGAVVSFELWVRFADGSFTRLGNLGFNPQHPRFAGALPTDEQVYADSGVPIENSFAAFWQEATAANFPLAGWDTGTYYYLPADLQLFSLDSFYKAFQSAEQRPTIPVPGSATPRPETALDRDGLAQFESSLFLDHDMIEGVSTENLLAIADFIRYQRPLPRPLQGIHAALGIEEATIIAVPDAVQRGWTSIYDGGDPQDPPAPKPQPPTAQLPAPTFQNCAVVPVTSAPTLTQPQPKIQPSSYALSWKAVGTAQQTVRYTLQESTSPDFAGAAVIYSGLDTSHTLYDRSPRDYYYRVNAQIEGIVSDWSNGVVVRVAPAVQWQYNTSEQYDTLPTEKPILQVQRALLRLCGARGDIFAVMVLPAHYREDAALTHVLQLKSSFSPETSVRAVDVGLSGLDEARAFSFGSLYHPWLIGRENSQLDMLRQTPPDGAAAGIMAQRALNRGAWIAPANEVMSNIVALYPPLARERWLDLQEAQLNIIHQEPRGFLYLSADTLSDDTELRSINVRRLLILLRRLALRLGADYVFEPNNGAFRRQVQRGFEAMLEQLFIRGALAGNTASEAFQVVTKSYLNTPQSIDQGRFIVELKVAPSLPLTFLTVRLLQSNDRALVTEG